MRVLEAALVAATAALTLAATCCPNSCSGKGKCNIAGNGCVCACFAGFLGADCSKRACPTGKAWASTGTGVDQAHVRSVCSNRGTCDHATGVCRCDPGFTGAACDRMGCPGGCGKNGECRSMKYLATQKDAGLPPPVVYTHVWDSDMIYGCMCLDRHTGPDCSQTLCPTGDDPLTGFAGDLIFGQQFNEMQSLTCAATAGTFTLSFRGLTTVPIQWNDPVAVFAAKLNALASIAHVAVTYASTTLLACPPAGNVIAIEFLHDFGLQPLLVGNPANLEYTAVGGTVQLLTARLQAGSKENAPCSNRGTCDLGTGVCTCYADFDTSDGYGNLGSRGDCGAATGTVTNCPGTVTPCSGHGYCSGEPQYACLCYDGWTSGDCSIRTCPQGPAWFDTPSSSNDAHHYATCSNAGICNQATGFCECAAGYEGAACQRLACPTTTAEPCSGHGQCLTQGRLSLQSTTWNGSPTPFTYGATPNNPMSMSRLGISTRSKAAIATRVLRATTARCARVRSATTRARRGRRTRCKCLSAPRQHPRRSN
ncbi:hypothetical protein SDRG_00101 [Saprolegnia diclina VS20]|uniref:EGF-like domain-containing protein n=1 Tax=Saprolegnia diclina (strain VS20) TaxID=1156394 RepID=T0SAK2_SAPDV|nr:hypothetical protein SDRG_00101 [Saprolegnia diclina VS20]EQC42363.1 hypothetical protein SDRG_00101 [Saprolegnia diclina VS20]|eukprot:XP_008603786.1 hypothetical protein SDRG_00101 [Saprolegnia diclina VS20]